MALNEKTNGNGSRKRSVIRVNLVGQDPEFRKEIKLALATVVEPQVEIFESEPRSASSEAEVSPGADVSMVLFNGDEEEPIAYLQAQSANAPRPVLFALLKERSPGLMKRVIRAGADELLFLPLDTGELTRALLKISEARGRHGPREGGVVCSVASVIGGVGVSTVAVNLALALRHTLKKSVALIDLDLQSGALAVLLNLEPEVTIMPLIRLEKKLDSIQLESALTKHSSGLYLLAAPKRIEEGELVSDLAIGSVINMMRDMFEYVVIDCGSHIDENAVAAWERTDCLLYILTQSVVSVRSAWRFIDLFDRLGLSTVEPRYTINKFVATHPITDKQLESTLGRPVFHKIPNDDKAVERAELEGKDLWQTAANSALVKSFEELANRIVHGDAVAGEPENGFMARLFSAFSAHT